MVDDFLSSLGIHLREFVAGISGGVAHAFVLRDSDV